MESHRKVGCAACLHAPESVPYIVHESAQARMERVTRRLWITVLILIALLVGTNGLWLWYESQFETVEVTGEFDIGDGSVTRSGFILNGIGDIEYGEDNGDG